MKTIKDDIEFNWGMIGLLALNVSYWVNVYYYGFFITTMWTIVITAIVTLCLRLSGRI